MTTEETTNYGTKQGEAAQAARDGRDAILVPATEKGREKVEDEYPDLLIYSRGELKN